jgi:hypothetical protein
MELEKLQKCYEADFVEQPKPHYPKPIRYNPNYNPVPKLLKNINYHLREHSHIYYIKHELIWAFLGTMLCAYLLLSGKFVEMGNLGKVTAFLLQVAVCYCLFRAAFISVVPSLILLASSGILLLYPHAHFFLLGYNNPGNLLLALGCSLFGISIVFSKK